MYLFPKIEFHQAATSMICWRQGPNSWWAIKSQSKITIGDRLYECDFLWLTESPETEGKCQPDPNNVEISTLVSIRLDLVRYSSFTGLDAFHNFLDCCLSHGIFNRGGSEPSDWTVTESEAKKSICTAREWSLLHQEFRRGQNRNQWRRWFCSYTRLEGCTSEWSSRKFLKWKACAYLQFRSGN